LVTVGLKVEVHCPCQKSNTGYSVWSVMCLVWSVQKLC